LLVRPAGADDRLTIAFSAARAARSPALEELFYFGPHPGNFAFEVGNPDLRPEHALGFDLSLRWRTPRVTGELTYFRNDINGYLFRAPLTEEEFDARLDEFAARFPSRDIEGPASGGGEEAFPIVEYVAADSVLQGIEAHSDVQVTPQIAIELGLDYVEGTLKVEDEPLPRIPPLRFRGGLRYQRNAFQAGGDVSIVAAQDRLFPTETKTDGYQLGRLYASYSFGHGAVAHTLTARLENVTNELYRNHLSLIKDLVPEMGRNFRLLYNVKF
jgi:iron complex outermembrane receptor protein